MLYLRCQNYLDIWLGELYTVSGGFGLGKVSVPHRLKDLVHSSCTGSVSVIWVTQLSSFCKRTLESHQIGCPGLIVPVYLEVLFSHSLKLITDSRSIGLPVLQQLTYVDDRTMIRFSTLWDGDLALSPSFNKIWAIQKRMIIVGKSAPTGTSMCRELLVHFVRKCAINVQNYFRKTFLTIPNLGIDTR